MKKGMISAIGLLAVVTVHAGISVVSGPTIVKDDDITGQMNFSGVTVQSGDVVAISSAPNKTSANLLSLQWSGSEGIDGVSSTEQSPDLGSRASYVFYTEIINGGTYDFTIMPTFTNLTARSGLHVLRATSGIINVADTSTYAQNTSTPGLSYSFAGAVSGAIAVESFSSDIGKTLIADAAYVLSENGSGRFILHSTTVSGSTWGKTHTCAEGAQDFAGAGVVFVEQSASPQPPVFSSDPVVETIAVTNESYTASLADHASDPNGDAMIFSVAPTNTWLSVTANGDLSGIPQVGDLGTNTWTVSVTDGISGTNSATLKILVVAGNPPPQTSQTNIIMIVIDDLGWMDLTVQGSQFYETPRIDQLAQSGMRFTQGYTPHPRCVPARYGFMTGRFPGANGVPGGPENSLRPTDTTIAEAFKAAGYATCFAGKWHLIGTHAEDNLPQNQGFDINIAGGKAGSPPTYFLPYKKSGEPDPADELNQDALFLDNTTPAGGMVTDRITGSSYRRTGTRGLPGEYITDRITDEALDWMDWNADKPMFLCMWHYGVHGPFEAPAGLISKYQTKVATMDYGTLPEYISSGIGQQKMRQDYPEMAGMIESVDTNIGRLIDKVNELGIASNTVLVFTSDNGGLSNRGGYSGRTLSTANYPLRTGKGWLYEGGIREAFFAAGPGVAVGVDTNSVVTGTDIYPTLLEMAGLPLQTNNHHDGVSFKAALEGSAYNRGKPIFWHSPSARPYATGDFNSSAVRDGDYKLIWWYDTPGKNYELYNVKTDIGENKDLAESMPAKAAELLGMIQAWHAGAHEGSGVVFKSDVDDVSKPPKPYLDDPTIPLLLVPMSGNADLTWDDYLGFDNNLFSRTNLLSGTWELESSGTTSNNVTRPMIGREGFYKVELILQPES